MFESEYFLPTCLQVYKTALLLYPVWDQTHLLVLNFHCCFLWFYNFHFILFPGCWTSSEIFHFVMYFLEYYNYSYFKEQKFIFSQFWRIEEVQIWCCKVQHQQCHRFGFSWVLSPWLEDSCLPAVSTYSLSLRKHNPGVSLCVQISSYKDTNPYKTDWIRAILTVPP